MRSSDVYRLLLGFFGRGANASADRAREAQRRHDWVAAEAHWAEVVRLSPNWAGAWVQRGNMLNELERRDEAIAAFTRAGEIDPALAHAPAGIAGVHERAGQWRAAEEAWGKAIVLLQGADPEDDRSRAELTHAFAHAALSARHAGAPGRAAQILTDAVAAILEMGSETDQLPLLVDLLPPGVTPAAAAFLKLFLGMLPGDVSDEIGSDPAIESGNLFLGLTVISPYLERGKRDATFLAVATGIYERARLWREATRLAEWQADLVPAQRKSIERAFRAAVEGRQTADARRLACRYARDTGELLLLHELVHLYEAVENYDRARLLVRFLRRRWTHSRWHRIRYITLTARTRSLPLADQLVRIEVAQGHRDRDLDYAYCRIAFDTGHYTEARLRLEFHVARHDDEEADVLLGYAIANCAGLVEADAYFMRLAAKRLQAIGPMVGLAHMAMRKRDLPEVLDRWSRLAEVHPGMNMAAVEMARVTYEMRDIDGAEAICERHLRSFPDDVAAGEFYAWLLTMNGKYERALRAIEDVQTISGRSWETADLLILCMGQLGTLDINWDRIVGALPSADTPQAASRIYHVLRILTAADRPDLASRLMVKAVGALQNPPWTWPYLETATDVTGQVVEAKQSWAGVRDMVRADYAERLDAMSDIAVDAFLLGRRSDVTVHIVNKFEQPRGGSELHALDLAAQIGRHAKVQLWAPEMPHPEFTARHGVRAIDPSLGNVPRGGIIVLVGIYFEVIGWIGHVRPRRIIFLYNTFESPTLFAQIDGAFQRSGVRPELLYCSNLMQRETGLPGRFEPSPTDLELFSLPTAPRPTDRPFTLGRHSRDVVEKHGADDWRVYQTVEDLGGQSLILGGSCMREAFPVIGGMHLMPSRSTEIPEFLHGLDAYFYRTSTWIEPWGRVVIEAMACGLPVVAHSHAGYAQAIEHDKNGLLFETTAEAEKLVRRLAQDAALRERLGTTARETVCHLLSSAEMKRLVAFYLL